MLSLISAAVATAPAAPALTDPVLADPVLADPVLADPVVGPVLVKTALANSTLANRTLARTALACAKPPVATPSRVRLGTGMWLGLGESAVRHDHAVAQLFGAGTRAAGQADFASQQRSDMKFTYPMARIAPTGGGGEGPYPARDPV